jgi:hypothetical protein
MRQIRRRGFWNDGPGGFRVPTPINPVIGNAEQRDSRNFGRPYDPRIDLWERGLTQEREQVAGGIVNIEKLLNYLTANNLPPQLVQATFVAQITAVNTPVRMIPKNKARQSLTVANHNSGVTGLVFSFDAPIKLAGNYAGIPIAASSSYSESNGTVTLNDVWVSDLNVNDPFPFYVIGYEGTLSITGNQR